MKTKNFAMALTLLLSTVFSVVAWAYIPPYWMIMSRTAESHGKGMYMIDQDVIFPGEAEPYIVNEKWYVLSEGNLRVEVTGRRELQGKINLVYIYDENRRHFIDEAGQRKALRTPGEFFEPLFHFRFSKSIKPYLVAQKIAPAESLKSEPHKYNPKETGAPPEENFLRLGRIDGTVAYVIGLPTLPNNENQNPGLWIEQDQFTVRQVRYPSQLKVTAKRYETFSQGFKFPREREVQFNNATIRIVTNSVNGIASSGENKGRVQSSSLAGLKDFKAQLPDEKLIRSFYSTVR